MNNKNNEKILLSPCATCDCFGHPNPEELWKSCPNMSETLPLQSFEMEDIKVKIEPRWLSNNAVSYQKKSIFQQFHEHLELCRLVNCVRYARNTTKEEYLMEAVLEYYLCINDLIVKSTDIKSKLALLKNHEYAHLYGATVFGPDLYYAAVGELPEQISLEYYNSHMRYTSNPFIWFYIQVQGVLFSKNLNHNIFLLPDIAELVPLKAKLKSENLLKLLETRSKSDLQRLKKFQWTNPISGCVWDFTKNPVIHSRDDSFSTINSAESLIIAKSLPKDFSPMCCDLIFKCIFGLNSFYSIPAQLLELLPNILPKILIYNSSVID